MIGKCSYLNLNLFKKLINLVEALRKILNIQNKFAIYE